MNDNCVKTMRDALIEQIYNKMFNNEKLFFVSADFGSPTLDKIRNKFPDRFINVGIAEQNLINVSTGLALEGFTVYAYAIAPFLTMRGYEQIRINLALTSQFKKINVNLIGVGAGVSYDVSGPTHHCFEDITIIRALPNFVLFSPSDWKLAEKFIDYSMNVTCPKYIRLDGKLLPPIYEKVETLNFEKGFHELLIGEEICIVSTGYMTQKALNIAEQLKAKADIGVIDVFLLKPVNTEMLFDAIKKYKFVITLEEAFIEKGGLDSIILNILKNNNLGINITSFGFKDEYVFNVGDRNFLHKQHGFDKENIIKTIEKHIKNSVKI